MLLINTTNFWLKTSYPFVWIKPKRMVKHFWQRLVRGFDDSEIWSLDHSLAKLILPRLKVFRDQHCSVPLYTTDAGWRDRLNIMILAFEIIADEDKYFMMSSKDFEIVEEGLQLFFENYCELWD